MDQEPNKCNDCNEKMAGRLVSMGHSSYDNFYLCKNCFKRWLLL